MRALLAWDACDGRRPPLDLDPREFRQRRPKVGPPFQERRHHVVEGVGGFVPHHAAVRGVVAACDEAHPDRLHISLVDAGVEAPAERLDEVGRRELHPLQLADRGEGDPARNRLPIARARGLDVGDDLALRGPRVRADELRVRFRPTCHTNCQNGYLSRCPLEMTGRQAKEAALRWVA